MSEKFTEADLREAVEDLATLPFFDKVPKAAVMRELAKMVPSRAALRWLVEEAKLLPAWPGLGELRGILCTRFDAADGIDRYCALPGYTASDGEQKSILRHEEQKALGNQSSPEFALLMKRLPGKVKEV